MKFLILLAWTGQIYAATFLPSSFVADFEQSHKSIIKGETKKSSGTLEYKYPGNIRLEIKKPDNIIFVSNTNKSWYYVAPFMDDEPGECTVKASSEMPLLKLLDVLQKGLVNNEYFKVERNKELVTLAFVREKQFGLKQARLKFSSGENFSALKGIELVHSDDKVVSLILSNVRSNASISRNRFVFEIPQNTKVLED